MKLTGDRNQCQGCKEFFNSIKGFDKHRRGTPSVDRRCLTSTEMLAKGMSMNAHGFWITAAMPFARFMQAQNTRDFDVVDTTLATQRQNVSNLNTQNLYNSQK